ncbi:MAG: hypothetical protein GY696_18820, partial [Gammaproteobacteria bacterium]|nr:hypothetical protein [Gammaproteobacteria bacterium]
MSPVTPAGQVISSSPTTTVPVSSPTIQISTTPPTPSVQSTTTTQASVTGSDTTTSSDLAQVYVGPIQRPHDVMAYHDDDAAGRVKEGIRIRRDRRERVINEQLDLLRDGGVLDGQLADVQRATLNNAWLQALDVTITDRQHTMQKYLLSRRWNFSMPLRVQEFYRARDEPLQITGFDHDGLTKAIALVKGKELTSGVFQTEKGVSDFSRGVLVLYTVVYEEECNDENLKIAGEMTFPAKLPIGGDKRRYARSFHRASHVRTPPERRGVYKRQVEIALDYATEGYVAKSSIHSFEVLERAAMLRLCGEVVDYDRIEFELGELRKCGLASQTFDQLGSSPLQKEQAIFLLIRGLNYFMTNDTGARYAQKSCRGHFPRDELFTQTIRADKMVYLTGCRMPRLTDGDRDGKERMLRLIEERATQRTNGVPMRRLDSMQSPIHPAYPFKFTVGEVRCSSLYSMLMFIAGRGAKNFGGAASALSIIAPGHEACTMESASMKIMGG